MRIVTKFTTEDELVESFSRYCTPTSCFIPSLQAKKTNNEDLGFSIRLANGTLMIRGMCTVLSSWADDINPFGRPGVQLGIQSVTPETQPIYDRLCRANEADEHERATVEMGPLFPPADLLDEPDTAGIPEAIGDRDSALNTATKPMTAASTESTMTLSPPGVDSTTPISAPATLLSLVAGRRTDQMEPLAETDHTVKTERPSIMTLLGVAPVTRFQRSSAPRMAMPALSPSAPAPAVAEPVALTSADRPTVAAAPRPRRSMWARVFGRLSALLRRVRWAYRRRRGVRATLRRLPTRT